MLFVNFVFQIVEHPAVYQTLPKVPAPQHTEPTYTIHVIIAMPEVALQIISRANQMQPGAPRHTRVTLNVSIYQLLVL